MSSGTKVIIQIAIQGFVIAGLLAVFIGCLAAFLTGNNDGAPDQLLRSPGLSNAHFTIYLTSNIINVVANEGGTQVISLDELTLPDSWTSDPFGYNPNVTLFYLTQSNVISVKPGSALVPWTVTSYANKGKFINQYPFDKYELELRFGVAPASASAFRQMFYKNEIPTLDLTLSDLSTYAWTYKAEEAIYWNSTLYQFNDTADVSEVDLSWLDNETTTDIMMAQAGLLKFVTLTIERTVIFRLYPVFQLIAFWLITVSILFLGSTTLVWERKTIDAPIIGFVVGLLFSLPNFRNSAPGAPPIGGLMDFSSFFWSIVTGFTVGLLLWFKNVSQLKINPPPPPSSDGSTLHPL